MLKTVLIVDDYKEMVDATAQWLEIRGIKVVGKAYDGLHGVELFKECNPDVTILDLMMPKYDGFYFLDSLTKTNPEAKIIILTGNRTKETDEKLKKYNPMEIFYKPSDCEKIVETITQ